jgi:hypothetical protein
MHTHTHTYTYTHIHTSYQTVDQNYLALTQPPQQQPGHRQPLPCRGRRRAHRHRAARQHGHLADACPPHPQAQHDLVRDDVVHHVHNHSAAREADDRPPRVPDHHPDHAPLGLRPHPLPHPRLHLPGGDVRPLWLQPAHPPVRRGLPDRLPHRLRHEDEHPHRTLRCPHRPARLESLLREVFIRSRPLSPLASCFERERGKACEVVYVVGKRRCGFVCMIFDVVRSMYAW